MSRWRAADVAGSVTDDGNVYAWVMAAGVVLLLSRADIFETMHAYKMMSGQ